ncbi:hypothetical protein An13g03120 [Aspergillus niger]|uniref:Uncharacterized protein n=2 Tax=Aspergillus niger TaxID=5061 RepID=A2R208_ASPNC|nr:hypothetical protein An13g03120 [Aspergillus niger]CAK41708.1 hypothetical protein An13g03120 [Aspergillus niger]
MGDSEIEIQLQFAPQNKREKGGNEELHSTSVLRRQKFSLLQLVSIQGQLVWKITGSITSVEYRQESFVNTCLDHLTDNHMSPSRPSQLAEVDLSSASPCDEIFESAAWNRHVTDYYYNVELHGYSASQSSPSLR